MKKLTNTEAELKESVVYKKTCSIKLEIFIHVFDRPFMISSHRIPPKQYVLYSGHSASASVVDKESNKITKKGERAVKK